MPVASLLQALNEGNERTEPETFEVICTLQRLFACLSVKRLKPALTAQLIV